MLTGHDVASTTQPSAAFPPQAPPFVEVLRRRRVAVPVSELRSGETETRAQAGTGPTGEDGMRTASTAEQRTRRLLESQGHAVTHEVDGSFRCAGCAGRGWIDRRGVLVADHPRSPLHGRCPRAGEVSACRTAS